MILLPIEDTPTGIPVGFFLGVSTSMLSRIPDTIRHLILIVIHAVDRTFVTTQIKLIVWEQKSREWASRQQIVPRLLRGFRLVFVYGFQLLWKIISWPFRPEVSGTIIAHINLREFFKILTALFVPAMTFSEALTVIDTSIATVILDPAWQSGIHVAIQVVLGLFAFVVHFRTGTTRPHK